MTYNGNPYLFYIALVAVIISIFSLIKFWNVKEL